MKQRDIKPCAVCGQGVMNGNNTLWYRVTVEHFAADVGAIKRQHGLEMMLGSPALAAVMGTDADLAHLVDHVHGLVCMRCAIGTTLCEIHDRGSASPEPVKGA